MKKHIVLTFLVLILVSCGPGYAKTPTPAPTATPQPPAIDTTADEIKAVFDGLDTIQVDELMLALADAGRQDTETAHTSELGQLIKDVAPVLPYLAVALFFVCCSTVALGALATWRAERKRLNIQATTSQIADLRAALESLRAYQQSTDVTPRNNGESENGTETAQP